MANYKKRQLIELLEALPEDSNIAFVAAHDMIEGDIVIPLGEFDEDHPNADCFFISAGDPYELAEIDQILVTADRRTTDTAGKVLTPSQTLNRLGL